MTLPDHAVDCLVVGPFPDPLHGQSVATRDFAETLRLRGCRVAAIDDSGSRRARFAALRQALHRVRTAADPCVYLSVNSNLGQMATALLAWQARRAGKLLLLHHHSFRYIRKWVPIAALLSRAAGEQAMHIVNCPDMGSLLARRYPRVACVRSLSNVGSVSDSLRPGRGRTGPVVIGHLSNLTEEKGIGRVVDSMARLAAAGLEARLAIAGPCSDAFAKRKIAEAEALLGDRFRYYGPVYGEQKAAFFEAIDIFAFPSLYPTETQGIVNLEALACGKPVVAFAQCCIRSDIGDLGGLAVEVGEDYAVQLTSFCKTFMEDRKMRSKNARLRFDQLTHIYKEEIALITTTVLERLSKAPIG
jgi:glycosyltransferase involved in cell wall biosynthesis